jgi:hypothetical protein
MEKQTEEVMENVAECYLVSIKRNGSNALKADSEGCGEDCPMKIT